MNPLDLTKEEITFIRLLHSAPERKITWAGLWLAQSIGALLFAAYAVWQQEMKWLLLALAMELGVNAWRLSRKQQNVPTWKSLSQKLLATLEPEQVT